MASRKPGNRTETPPSVFEQARDEFFSHILSCVVLEATVDHPNEWFDDTNGLPVRSIRHAAG